jgi:protein tyrosine phosphatase (PTP) superfamily phosphohydrolase (DUF442 family)
MAGDPDDIRNFLRLPPRITTSGALREADPQRLATIGVARVINLALHTHPEALGDAARTMAAAGLAYTHIPVPFDAPTQEHYRAFVAALEADSAPTHVHCIMNWRVSAFFYRWHVEACSMPEPEARALLEQIWSPHTRDDAEAAPWRAFVQEVG